MEEGGGGGATNAPATFDGVLHLGKHSLCIDIEQPDEPVLDLSIPVRVAVPGHDGHACS